MVRSSTYVERVTRVEWCLTRDCLYREECRERPRTNHVLIADVIGQYAVCTCNKTSLKFKLLECVALATLSGLLGALSTLNRRASLILQLNRR